MVKHELQKPITKYLIENTYLRDNTKMKALNPIYIYITSSFEQYI